MRKLHPFSVPYSKCLKRLIPPLRPHLVELNQAPSAKSSDSLIEPNHPHYNRALDLAALRILHLAHPVAQAYSEQFQRQYGKFHPGLPADPAQALKSKNLPILIGIYCICSEESISLRHWFRAQFEILHKMKQVYLVTCSGPNALVRYKDWASRQASRFTTNQDRHAALNVSLYGQIEASILDSHLVAIRNWESIKRLDPPCLSAALLALYPQVSAWYLLAYTELRDLLQSGDWTDSVLESKLKQFKKSYKIRQSCSMGLDSATELHGRLEL